MVAAVGRDVSVGSIGWRGEHRLWSVMAYDGQERILTGPPDASEALLKAWRSRERLFPSIDWSSDGRHSR